jgi:hypothetical protein
MAFMSGHVSNCGQIQMKYYGDSTFEGAWRKRILVVDSISHAVYNQLVKLKCPKSCSSMYSIRFPIHVS